jgi:hypothetical protein
MISNYPIARHEAERVVRRRGHAGQAVFKIVPTAELSKGEKMMPVAPRVMESLTPVICFAERLQEIDALRLRLGDDKLVVSGPERRGQRRQVNGDFRPVRRRPPLRLRWGCASPHSP